MKNSIVIVFVKYPLPGAVKKRLAEHLGSEQAAAVYKTMVELVLRKIAPAADKDYTVEICFTPDEKEPLIRAWLTDNKIFHPQQGKDLGERMCNAFKHAFEQGYEQAVLMGSDCPDISREIIIQGFTLLAGRDVVLGPACDGGYYLIGMKKLIPELFNCIAWGCETVLQQTQEIIQQCRLSLGLLPMLRDIDRIEDLEHYNFI